MTDETKKLFDVPLQIVANNPDRCYEIYNALGDRIASNLEDIEDAKRFHHLPELYDALAETIEEHCDLCINYTGDKPKMLIEEILKFGCPTKSKTCHCIKNIELLKKVRDGK